MVKRKLGANSILLGNSSHDHPPSDLGAQPIPTLMSSPDSVFEVIRRFDQRKKDIVRAIGFSGLLNLSRFGDLDPKFTLWLFKKVRWNTTALVVGDKINFVIRAEHVGKIIGIPYSGYEVTEKCFESDEEKTIFLKNSLSFLGNERDILLAAESHLALDLPFRCSKEHLDKFKVAFVIFVMGRFLAPSLQTNGPRTDFFGAIRNPDAIHSFNWSAFVLCDLIEASRKVLWYGLDQMNVTTILGCPIILQILYLDIIELGNLKLQHDVTPRIKHFNRPLLNKMISADYLKDDIMSGLPIFGRAETLRGDNICYNLRNVGPTRIGVCTNKPPIGGRSNPSVPPNTNSYIKQEESPKECSTKKNCVTGSEFPSPKIKDLSTKEDLIRDVPCRDTILQVADEDIDNVQNFTTPMSSTERKINIRFGDYSNIMRDFFNGQVDSSLLGHFKLHQAMCLTHITKFSNALKDALTSENITLASKVVNHQRLSNGLAPINIDQSSNSALRRTYDDMLSGAESGEDRTPGSIPLNGARRGSARGKTSATTGKHHFSPSCSSLDASYYAAHSTHHSKFTTPLNKTLKSTFDLHSGSENQKKSRPSENQDFIRANLSVRMLSAIDGSDLKDETIEAGYYNGDMSKTIVEPGKLAISHWAMNIDHPIRDIALTHSFYDWISCTMSADLDRPWIIHSSPRFIKLTGHELKDCFTDIHPLAYDPFDICIRRLSQLDSGMWPNGVRLRWRHLIESDFSMHVLGGENPANHLPIKQQFLSEHLGYELAKCRMFFVPVYVSGLWWCYVWDMKYSTITISDPSVGPESDELVLQKHAGTIGLLSSFLSKTINEFYTGWNPKFEECNYVVHRTPDMPIERSQSAFFTLFFIKNFNGTNLTSSTSATALKNFKAQMLYEILELKNNQVHPPNAYIHSIED